MTISRTHHIADVSHVRRVWTPVQLRVSGHNAVPAADAHLRSLVHGQLFACGKQLRRQLANRWTGWLYEACELCTKSLRTYVFCVCSFISLGAGQKNEPFVTDLENEQRTPRPDWDRRSLSARSTRKSNGKQFEVF